MGRLSRSRISSHVFPHADFQRAVDYVRTFRSPAQLFAISVRQHGKYTPEDASFPEIVIENATAYRNNFPQDIRAAAAMLLMSGLVDAPDDETLRALVTALYAAAPDALRRLYQIEGDIHHNLPLPGGGIVLGLTALRAGLRAYGQLQKVADQIPELWADATPPAARSVRSVPQRATVSPSATFAYLYRVLTGNPIIRQVAEQEAARILNESGGRITRSRPHTGWADDLQLWETVRSLRKIYHSVNSEGHQLSEEEAGVVREATRRMAALIHHGAVAPGDLVGSSFPTSCPALAHILYAAMPSGARGASRRKFASVLPEHTLDAYETRAYTAEEALVRASAGAVDVQRAIAENVLPVLRDFRTAIVLDISASMEPAVKALNTLMYYLSQVTVRFERPIRLITVGNTVSHSTIRRPEVFSIQCGGFTPLHQGIRMALLGDPDDPEDPRPDVVIVLTDWEHNVEQTMTAGFRGRKVTLSGEAISPEEIRDVSVFSINFRGGSPRGQIREHVMGVDGDPDHPEHSLIALSNVITAAYLRRMDARVITGPGRIEIILEV